MKIATALAIALLGAILVVQLVAEQPPRTDPAVLDYVSELEAANKKAHQKVSECRAELVKELEWCHVELKYCTGVVKGEYGRWTIEQDSRSYLQR